MRVLKHIERVNHVKLDLTQVRQLIIFLLTTAFLLWLHLLQLHVNLMLDRAVPASDQSIVKGSQDAASRAEIGDLQRCDGSVDAFRDSIDSSHVHIVASRV